MTGKKLFNEACEWLNSAVLDRRSEVPLWRQVEELLAKAIRVGQLKPGNQLPTEFALADHFSVNRHTIRRALANLETQSLLRVEKGRGTFVHENVIDYQLSRRTRFSANIRSQNREPSGELLETDEIPASAIVAKALGLDVDEPVIWMRHLSYVDGRPVSLSDHYFPLHRFRGFLEVYRQRQSITATYAYFGVFDYLRISTRITTRMPSVAEADLLKQPKNRPVLVTDSVNRDTEGAVIEYVSTAFNGEIVQLIVAEGDV